jgi:hypothetical protein
LWGRIRPMTAKEAVACVLIIGCFPIILWFILKPLEWFVAYIEWGQEHFGIENRSFGLAIWVMVPWFPLYFSKRISKKMKANKARKKESTTK